MFPQPSQQGVLPARSLKVVERVEKAVGEIVPVAHSPSSITSVSRSVKRQQQRTRARSCREMLLKMQQER